MVELKYRPEATHGTLVKLKYRPEATHETLVKLKYRPEATHATLVKLKYRPEATDYQIFYRSIARGTSLYVDRVDGLCIFKL